MLTFSRCFSILVFILFILGILEFFHNGEENQCEMTYMYRKPQFISVSLPADVKVRFPRYGLYIYGEGEYAERLATGARSGAPVLFIPGNGGSFKQVRSLASVAQMMAEDEHRSTLLDIFAVDFDEDLAALNGRLLRRQTAFLAHCVARIVAQYSTEHSLVIVAHSMGGVVARALLKLPGFDPTVVRVIYALASPLHRPPVYMDGATRRFYSDISEHWRQPDTNFTNVRNIGRAEEGGRDSDVGSGGRESDTEAGGLSGVSVVSIAGGERDLQVRLHQTVEATNTITTSTLAVPGVWVAADHQCIVWCRQLVLVTVRSLFDLVTREGFFYRNVTIVRSVLRYHFSHRPHGKRYWCHSLHAGATVTLQHSADWLRLNSRQDVYITDSVRKVTYLTIELSHEISKLTITTVGVSGRNWLLACSPDPAGKCAQAEDLGHQAQVLPSGDGRKRRSVVLPLSSVRELGYTHLLIALYPTKNKVAVYTDAVYGSDREVTALVPELSSFRAFFGSHTVVGATQPSALVYNISLQGLSSTWQAVRLLLTPASDCLPESSPVTPLLRLHVPGLLATDLAFARKSDEAMSIVAKLPFSLSATSGGDLGNFSIAPYVEAHLNPRCTYSINVQNSLIHMAGNVVRLNTACIVPCAAAVLMWALTEQMTASGTNCCPGQMLCHTAVGHVTPVKLAAPAQLVTAAVSFLVPLLPALPYISSWTDDTWPQLPLLPLGTLLVARSLLWAWSYMCHALILFAGFLLQHAATAVFRRAGITEWLSELAISLALHYSWSLAVACLALAFSSCGTVALIIGLIITFIKVFKMYEDKVMDELKMGTGEGAGTIDTSTSRGTMLTLALIWCLVTGLNLPSLIVWSQTISESRCLVEDPSLFPAVCMCISGAILWKESSPMVPHNWSSHVVWLVRVMAVITMSRDLHSWHVISSWLTAVVMVTSLSQLITDRSHPGAVPVEQGTVVEQGAVEDMISSNHDASH